MIIGSAAAVLVVSVVVPRLAGATPYTVLTGSMRPGLPPGTLVVVRPVDAEDVAVGSVITYQIESGEPEVVTHRVISKRYDASGRVSLRTQGDANDVPDREWVRPEQVRGEVWYSLPYLGYASRLLTGEQRQGVLFAVVATLLLYAVAMFASAARDRRRARPGPRVEVRS